jgi:hypothetical protein
MKNTVLFMFIILAIAGCRKDDPPKEITGQITFDFNPGAGDYYIILDKDQDLSNGYIIRLIETSVTEVGKIDYIIKSDNIPAGSYYIRGGYDSESPDNMDPGDPSVWEGQGWYGSYSSVAPASPNVTDITGKYDFVIYALAK